MHLRNACTARLVAGAALALFFALHLGPVSASICSKTSVGFIPLTELDGSSFKGFPGGLYPSGNLRPPMHESSGLGIAKSITPRASNGQPSAGGRIVLVSIGMSNTTREFSTFVPMAQADPARNAAVSIVDGAQSGVTAKNWSSLSCSCWNNVDTRLSAQGLTASQVQVAWVKVAEAAPTQVFPADVAVLQTDLTAIMQNLKVRFPNIKIAYVSSRIYAGYASTPLNPEPYAYQSGFAVKGLIEDQIDASPALNFNSLTGPVKAPWLSWGPYLWADGTKARRDGLTWVCSDFGTDGTHPSTSGSLKVATRLLDFFKTDTTAKIWFLRAT